MTVIGIEFPPITHLTRWPQLLFQGTPFAINKTTLIYVAATLLTLAFFIVAGRRAQLVPHGVQNLAEMSIDFIRESVILQTMGHEGLVFLPFLLSMFFFVFLVNIFEIIPFVQFPGNARMAVPALLAGVVWVIYNAVGIKKQGLGGYLKHSLFPPGVPKFLLPLVALIEFFSTFFVRPLSLAVRLFANMLAGHFILVTFVLLSADLFRSTKVGAVLPFALLVALTGFEILVSVLQAFIFSILTAVYIGGAMHSEH